jgi:broad specificity phosphatase PhoE
VSEIVLVRHGATDWSAVGRHTGRTDRPLSEAGERGAAALAPLLSGRTFGLVLVSPLIRARRTAELAGVTDYALDDDLVEWDYGSAEGRTTAEMSDERGGPWSVWGDGPVGAGAETVDDVAARGARVLSRAMPTLDAGGDVLLVGHGHALRILAADWLGLAPRGGALLALSAGSVSALGFEHDRHVVSSWNVTPARP